ncbi:MAG: OmpA family protein [Thiobacillus sp.]|nr:OmpA family protein [Thiobacillus sp.]
MTSRNTLKLLAPVAALMTSLMPLSAKAEDACTQIIVYAVKQFCSLLPNGQSLCQPVALTGPAPACQFPQPTQFKPVPLAPPSLQFTPAAPMAVPTPFPGLPMPYPTPYLPSPMAAQPVSPFALPPVAPTSAPPSAFTPPQAPAVQPAVATTTPAATPAVSPAPDLLPPKASATSPAIQPSPSASPAPVVVALPLPQQTPSVASQAQPVSKPVSQAAATATVPAAMELPEAPMLPVVVAEARALFAFDSAELSPLGKETLDSWLATAPVGMPVVISGHADRLGPEPYNLELSLRRATAARDYLVAKGKDVRDIRIIAMGELEPVKQCKGGPTEATKACLAPNRRVLISPE